MSQKHTVVLTVIVDMDEMDGTVEQSAEIATFMVQDCLAARWDANADVYVSQAYEADD